jgi:hypothetical protein
MPEHAKAIDALSAASSRAEALVVLRRAFADAGIDTPDLDAACCCARSSTSMPHG